MTEEKSTYKPWEMPGVPWKTEAAFWSWVRGVLRKGWSVHPVRIEFVKTKRKRIPSKKKEGTVWGCACEICGEDFVQSECETDHVNPAGSLRCEEDIKAFVEKLLIVTFDDLRILCKECHAVVTLSQKLNVSFEQASVEKEVIALCKLPASEQDAWIEARGLVSGKNAKERRSIIRTILEE